MEKKSAKDQLSDINQRLKIIERQQQQIISMLSFLMPPASQKARDFWESARQAIKERERSKEEKRKHQTEEEIFQEHERHRLGGKQSWATRRARKEQKKEDNKKR